jgi:hypothetical protein
MELFKVLVGGEVVLSTSWERLARIRYMQITTAIYQKNRKWDLVELFDNDDNILESNAPHYLYEKL